MRSSKKTPSRPESTKPKNDEDWEYEELPEPILGNSQNVEDSGLSDLLLSVIADISKIHVLLEESKDGADPVLNRRVNLLSDLVKALPRKPLAKVQRVLGFRLQHTQTKY